jgi:hypothetical protein
LYLILFLSLFPVSGCSVGGWRNIDMAGPDRLPPGRDKENIPVGMFIENFSGVKVGAIGTGLQIINWCYLATLLVAKALSSWRGNTARPSTAIGGTALFYIACGLSILLFAPLYNPQNTNPCGGPY